MNLHETLRALYAGEISPEDAKKALTIEASPMAADTETCCGYVGKSRANKNLPKCQGVGRIVKK